jgi:hypothetical protein
MSFLDKEGHSLLGVGVYTVPQAARLVRLPVASVELVVGPDPTDQTPPRLFPIAVAELDLGFGEKIITFRGLMELWVAAQLRDAGISWPIIRFAGYQASRVLRRRHPLTFGNFRTDGRTVFLSLRQAKRLPKTAIDLLDRQQVFEDVIEQSLRPAIIVRDREGRIQRWFPLGSKRQVVLDPERRFGEPIDPVTGVPTASLSEAFRAEHGNAAAAARWFGATIKAVRDAVLFERWLNKA